MANYITSFLQSQGIKSPFGNMTEAQINEQNKSNPLASFGFMSAQDKQRRQLEQKLLEAEQKRQQDELQQRIIAQMSSQEKIGYYSGSGLMGLMHYLKNKGASPEVEAAPQDDPALARFNQLAMEVGPEMAMQIVGQEQGNAAMVQQADQMRSEKDKAALEARYKNSQISSNEALVAERNEKLQDPNRNYEHKPGYTEEIDVMMDGKPAVQKRTLIRNTPDGGEWKYSKPALKGSVTGDAGSWETSKGGINERTKAMEGAITSTANALDAYDKMEQLVKEAPAGLGWTGKLISQADTIVSGVQNLGRAVAEAEGREIKAPVTVDAYKWDKVTKIAGTSEKMKSLILQLAYAQAAATGDSSRSLSDRDVQNQIDIIGGSITNPENFLDLMRQNKEVLVSKLENMGKYTRIDGQPIYEHYKQDIEGLKTRAGIGAPKFDIQSRYGSEEAAVRRLRELEAKHGKKQ